VHRTSSPYGDGGAARAFHLGTAGIEKVLQIDNFRFPCGIRDRCYPLGAAGGQHQILRRTHRGQAQQQIAAGHTGGAAVEHSAVFVNFRTQIPQTGQMQIDGPGPQLTAAWITQIRLSAPGKNRPQENGGRPHLPHQIVGDLASLHGGGVYHQRIPLPGSLPPQMVQNGDRCLHIPQSGAALQYGFPPVQQGCR